MMEVVVTAGAISHAKLQSNHHHQQTNIKFLLEARCPSCRPTNSVKAVKGIISHSTDLLTPSSPGGLPTLSLITNSSWLPWGRFAMTCKAPVKSSPSTNQHPTFYRPNALPVAPDPSTPTSQVFTVPIYFPSHHHLGQVL